MNCNCEKEHVEIPTCRRIAKFEKVSFEQFKNGMLDKLGNIFVGKEDLIQTLYEDIKLPKRGTRYSAGYDFFAPFSFELPSPGSGIIIPTGIRCKMDTGWVLKYYPRSGQGTKYGLELYNTVGIIDSDYYSANNEGHIYMKITSKENSKVIIDKGVAFFQGVFVPYGITVDDDVDTIRTGGYGSTDGKSLI